MRKIILMILCFIFLILCVGCSGKPEPYQEKKVINSRYDINLFVDKKTGVNYLVSDWGGLTPRLDENGKVIISKHKKNYN